MRIAYFTQSYPPMVSGAAILVERLAKSMAARGHQVLVIAASDKNHPYVSYEENLTILRLKSIHNPLRVGQRFLFYPRFKILQALNEFCPDIIHTHEPLLMSQLGLEYAGHAHIPILLTVHQVPWFAASYLPNITGIRSHVESILWAYARRISRQFTSVITPSQTISDLVKTMTNIQPMTISNGIPIETFQSQLPSDDQTAIRKKLNLPRHVPVILHVGRLDIDKNVERIIQAAAQVMQQTEAHLLIIGDGSQKHTLVKMCETLKIADRVHFPGYIALQQGLPEIYRLASLFITASEIEVQSLVLLEALASGLPIVAVRATFIPEIVHQGANGFLAESGDIHGLANAISTLLKNPKQCREMGKVSRILAEAHDIHLSMDLHEQFYSGLVKQIEIQPVLEKVGTQSPWTRMKEWTGIIE
ncbi:MAG TPA: glycosyltransferase [Anaerolineales bacterium]|nr:glycosyltransferase [Anaerolineales bacterium]